MATLVDQAFGILANITDTIPGERARRMRDGLKAFERLRENYGLDALPDFTTLLSMGLDAGPGKAAVR